ncbi:MULTISPECIES: hypothetical protein [unclassified Duganella]|uniref:hypothetical protein n=1 Tax=unclassified Duganella TaxID=2636909 RepID=UPI00070236A4|nr:MULTISPECIES: hypothetical protein [unclassified Duganella]KQV59690.1 diguanylate cyclase [Duganella sp. Root336D2]KRB87370.1 diguanylate cyclase [Duganella sp. Root198D2]
MHIFDTVTAQISAMGLPLFAVSATRASWPDTPLLLFLHWHGFRRATPLQLQGVSFPTRAVASSALQFNGPWTSGVAAEEALLDVAWRLGAWQLERLEQRPCNMAGAAASEAFACRQAFGDNAAGYQDQPVLGGDPDTRTEQMELAARKGYRRWLFQPVKGGLWEGIGPADDSLAPDGGRLSDCPVKPAPTTSGQRVVYQLGRHDRFFLP